MLQFEKDYTFKHLQKAANNQAKCSALYEAFQ